MNDDDLTELILRASAYLDDELDADDRARAEADPAVMAEVEALRALQDEIRDVESPTIEARESAIAAALAEFDSLRPASATAAAAAERVVPFRPRPSSSRWLTAAAAAVAIGLVGVVVAQTRSGGDDEASVAIEADRGEGAAAERTDAAAADADIQSSVTDSDLMATEMVTAEAAELAEAPVATIPPAAAVENDTTLAGGEEVDVPAATEPTTLSTLAPIDVPQTTAPRTLDEPVTEDTLFAVGRELLAQFEAGTLGTTPETACQFGSYVILARVGFVVGDGEREAIIAADPDFPEVGAFDADTCQEFAIVTGE